MPNGIFGHMKASPPYSIFFPPASTAFSENQIDRATVSLSELSRYPGARYNSVRLLPFFDNHLKNVFGIGLHWGLTGVWIALSCDEWIRGLTMLFRWKSGRWRSRALIGALPV